MRQKPLVTPWLRLAASESLVGNYFISDDRIIHEHIRVCDEIQMNVNVMLASVMNETDVWS